MDEMRIHRALSGVPTVLLVAALVFFYAAVRVVGAADEGAAYPTLLTLSGLSLAVALVLRVMSLGQAGDASSFVKAWLGSAGAIVAGALLYFASRDLEEGSELGPLLLSLGLLLLVSGAAVAFALQWAAKPMREAGHVEPPRLGFAAMSAGIAVSAVGALAGLNFVAAQSDLRADLSFGAPTRPSLATTSLLQASDEPVEIFLFFERGSPVITEVGDYFEGLEAAGAQVERLDSALDPELAKAMKVSKNGSVGFRVGDRTDSWYLGTTRDQARRKLKKIDEEVATRLAKLTREEKTLYFTVGHGERDEGKAARAQRPGSSELMDEAEVLNVKKKKLGLGQGLGSEVPADADLVVILGPTKAFLDAEVDALVQYVERGGALLLTLDPHLQLNLDRLLAALALRSPPGEVNNDKEFVVRTRTAADHAFILSTSFTSHKAVKSLNEARGRAAVLFVGAAALEKADEGGGDKEAEKDAGQDPDKDADKKVTFLARSRNGSFLDLNRNRIFDAGSEGRSILNLAAAVEVPRPGDALPGRAVVIGDSETFADSLMPNEANQDFAADALRWLMRDDAAAGAFDSDEDVPIFHTKDGDSAWFYGTTFLAPLVVLFGGLGLVRARRRRRRS